MPLYRNDLGLWAFSVRPDLWPPGTLVMYQDGLGRDGYLATRATDGNWARRMAVDGAVVHGSPGAAEALVLAGAVWLIALDKSATGPWEEVT